jgi:diguanylate cyclase (GGDEF)-like protein/PAS domain S-box-containing protein
VLRSAFDRLLGRTPSPRSSEDATFRRVVEQSADVICRFVEGRFCYVSPSVVSVLGWHPDDIVGTDGSVMVHEDDRHIIQDVIARLMSGVQQEAVSQVRAVCSDGSLKWAETTARIERSGTAHEMVLVIRDITTRKQLEEELAAMALQDGLTGLANRRAFDQAFHQEWKQTLRTGGQMAVLLLDIDYFKQFNDLYGHQAGDDCLRAVAASIQGLASRPTDTACRYGGEEVVVILGNTNLAAAVSIAEKMRSSAVALGIPHEGSACADHVTVSIGVAAAIARTGGSMRMPEGLLQAADHALYKAKAHGRNRVEQSILIAPTDP